MQITIWREYSSNHSSRFTVVGVFESAEKAERAAAELMDMVRTILDWYQQPEHADALQERQDGCAPPSPPEMHFARQYGVEWSMYSLDWLWDDGEANRPVRTFENLVFIDGTESKLGAKPADALMAKLGGQVLVDGSIVVDELIVDLSIVVDELTGMNVMEGMVTVSLTCTAPDEATAQTIYDEMTTYLNAAKQDISRCFDTPWRSADYWHPSSFTGTIQCEGRKIAIEQGSFFSITYGLPAMIRYLQNKGCTGIRYTLTERRSE